MRALWSQIPRPRLSGSLSISSTDAITCGLVRKSTTAPLRRRPTFNDAFTVLLAPVLAACLIVDTSWKAQQRKEWDEKLATINEEIDQLKQREAQTWKSIQLRSIRNVISQQRRGYATAVHARERQEESEYDIDMPMWEDRGRDLSSLQGLCKDVASPDSTLRETNSREHAVYSPQDMANFHRYHRLNAIMLAIKMLLHLRIGPSPFFEIFPGDDDIDRADLQFPQDTNQLVDLLKMTRKEIRPLKKWDDLIMVAPQLEAQAKKGALTRDIRKLTHSFDEGKIPLTGLIEGFGKVLMQSDEIPCVWAYTGLIRSLSKVGSFSLAYHVTAALKNSTLPLTDDAIFHIIFQIGKACDSRSLNHILQIIARSDNQLNLETKWEKVYANGLDLPVPVSLHPGTLQVLIYAALRCEQPERAEGWLTLLQEADYSTLWKDHLFRSFLSYYSSHSNWTAGKVWLKRSVQHALSIATQNMDALARVIFRMLDLCVRCRKLPEYTMILDAAVNAGIRPPAVSKNANSHKPFHARARSILLEWESLPIPEDADSLSTEDKAKRFQEACRPLLEEAPSHTAETKKPSQVDDSSDLVLMPATTHYLRYSVRRRLKEEPSPGADHQSNEASLRDLAGLQGKIATQEAAIASLRGQLAIAEQKQIASQQQEQERLAREQELQRTTRELQEALQESRTALEQLQAQNQGYAKEHAELRAEITELKEIARRFMQQKQLDNAVQRKMQPRAEGGEVAPKRAAATTTVTPSESADSTAIRATSRLPVSDPSVKETGTAPPVDTSHEPVSRSVQAGMKSIKAASNSDVEMDVKIRMHGCREPFYPPRVKGWHRVDLR
ncbi:hypothetical protein HRR83_007589 [Exophiala dermatitidis]|uniref:Uncharacterized protein n=1 Tax=Exophiala dermatitidis TaxID=5970 RepID=A0AAN6IVF3_EXODE|nr:hypothetical protein HRR75_006585 [Exophiala dermatitidis]KAJ4510020.1 hypothetical protein HRR74_007172 [Exophiala dermatitidis]KAJ4521727.1 hypothetical protein HRR73_002925 [Exophiala dermatitidis]KAJ4539419.1 hypothetical protein HRR77_006306 [Exophiala dermatitidis]KAJ4542790.1 hypothetical protein HRR78_006879 [Exophiala dermatitidis]